jgi:hypothetical protein
MVDVNFNGAKLNAQLARYVDVWKLPFDQQRHFAFARRHALTLSRTNFSV